jgi:hypothetical protein
LASSPSHTQRPADELLASTSSTAAAKTHSGGETYSASPFIPTSAPSTALFDFEPMTNTKAVKVSPAESATLQAFIRITLHDLLMQF